MTKVRRPVLPFHHLSKRYPAATRLVYEGLADQYLDARLHQDPRDIVSMMLASVRSFHASGRDQDRLRRVLRQLNTPPEHGFHCPLCYETRFEKIVLSSILTQHGVAMIATPTQISVQPSGCRHQSFEARCKTCETTWLPSHRLVAGASFEITFTDRKPNSEMN